MALKEKKLMTEILERALLEHEKSLPIRKGKNSEILPVKKESPKNFFHTSAKKIPNHKEFKDNSPKTCSFFGKDDKTQEEFFMNCLRPLFDKKKGLCRSHNRQARKRFDKFLKDKSISTSAG
jgi:hypothetical protein